MASLDEFCSIKATLDMNVIGETPAGMRINFPFTGTAISSHWEGERPVGGVDYVTVRSDGHMRLDIHGVIGEGRQKVSYTATGVSLAGEERGTAFPHELLTFETADQDLGFLNTSIAVGLGSVRAGQLELTVWLVHP
ncbi:MAG: DUF3237 domain-containing protein [Acidimicrobiia bacterium]|nr:DUF3237 domain-containing protein [Acidimicrobiia bacterium]